MLHDGRVMYLLPLTAAGIFAINLPFGYWRAGCVRFRLGWFLAVHGAVPLAYTFRVAMGVPFRLATLPLFVAAYFGGQVLGSRLRARRRPRP